MMMVQTSARWRESSCSNLGVANVRSKASATADELRESAEDSLLANTSHETGDAGLDTSRITMRTRVAVRDKTPHRFQVVPLREVGRSSTNSSFDLDSTENRSSSYATAAAAAPVTPKKGSNRNYSSTSTASSFGWKHSSKSDWPPSDATPSKRPSVGRRDASVSSSHDSLTAIHHKHGPTADANSKRMESARSCTFGSSTSLAADKSAVLSEWDMNLVHNFKPTHKPENAGHTSSSTSTMSIDSIHELIRSESPLTQTISRSLRHRATSVTGNVIKQPKSNSLGNMATFNSQQAEIRLDVNNVCTPSSSRDQKFYEGSDDRSYYSLLDAYGDSETSLASYSSSKRHAIYTPSLHVPRYDHRLKSGDSADSLRDEDPFSSGDQQSSVKESLHEEDPDITLRATEERTTQGPSARPGLKHKSSSRSLPFCVPRGLKHSKPLHATKYTGMADGSRPGAVVYPRIVLNLFADIDKAIEEWTR